MTPGLTDSQKQHLLSTFGYVDRLLNDALQSLSAAEAPSPFQRCVPDSLPIQRKVLADYLASLRAQMVRVLEKHGIEIPKPQVSSLWSFKTSLMSAAIAIEELRPKYMRGYGDLTDDATSDLEALASQITDILDRMSNYLTRGTGPDLQARLERLEKTTRELEWAGILEQVITAHGLVELRPSLDTVVERLESNCFEVAVFGRVSSGKSSLLDYILRTDALPVGVTPVTAIPARVVFGSHPQARIGFAEKEPIAVELRELAQYVTEQGNPDNAKHVTRIQVELPADRLKDGVTFVDTPGLGSLARYGEMESLAYLPRCDLGIVLVDAASTLVSEDAQVVNALRQAGAEVMVLLTKADILGAEERTAAARYIEDQLRSNLGFDVPVHMVSVKGGDAALCDHWFDTALVPRLHEHKRLAELSLRRKVGLLRDATVAVLRRQLEKHSGTGKDLAREWSAAEPKLNEALAKLETAMRDRPTWPGLADRILDDAAHEIADTWWANGTAKVDAAATVISCASRHISLSAGEVAQSLALLRENLAGALQAASVVSGDRDNDTAEIPAPSGMPIMELAGSLPETLLHKPVLSGLLNTLAFRKARAQLQSQIGVRLQGMVNQHLNQLNEWRSYMLTQMRQSFSAKADFCRIQCEQVLASTDLDAVKRDIQRLRALEGDAQPLSKAEAAVRAEQPQKE